MEHVTANRICVFCGSRDGDRPVYRRAAMELGSLLVERRIGLVYGGARVGTMGVIADAVLAGRGEVLGVIPQTLVDREVAHHGVTALHIVRTMHERKQKMADLSDAVIALPGGFGTMDEFFEIVTWGQLGLHQKPVGLLNIEGFYDHLLSFVQRACEDGFVAPEHRDLFIADDDPARLLDRMLVARKPSEIAQLTSATDARGPVSMIPAARGPSQ